MLPLVCRLAISVAAWIVPRSKRAEWKQEWLAELWHRAESGADAPELFHRARGAFRDAAWFLHNERKKHGFDLFRKPLRTELAFFTASVLICAFTGALKAPQSLASNARRLVTIDHATNFSGGRDSMFRKKYVALVRLEGQTLEDVAAYRLLRDKTSGLLVSRNFFTVFGVQPLLGRGFEQGDSDDSAILSEDFWRTWFRSDPRVIGASKKINKKWYTIVGVMPRGFRFRFDELRFYAPLDRALATAGFVGLLAPGETVQSAQSELRIIASEIDSGRLSNGIEAQPLIRDSRPGELLFGAIAALGCALAGVAFLAIKRLGGPRYCLLLGLRVLIGLLALDFLRLCETRLLFGPDSASSIFSLWIYLLICTAATLLLIMDQRARCLVCFARLRMPAPIGVYSSQILDQPVTEYVCPAGHGALVVAGNGNAADHWTVLDETWHDLFVHTE